MQKVGSSTEQEALGNNEYNLICDYKYVIIFSTVVKVMIFLNINRWVSTLYHILLEHKFEIGPSVDLEKMHLQK